MHPKYLRHKILALTSIFAALVWGGASLRAAGEHDHHRHGSSSADKAKSESGADAEWLAKARAEYPLTTCVVSGDKLGGDMGEAVDYVHKEKGKPDRLVRFCCKSCIGDFKEEPAKYLKKIDEAARAESRPVTEGQSETGPTAGTAELTSLAFALADASAALAADDLAGYRKQLPELRAALADYRKTDSLRTPDPFKDAPPDPADLASARRDFAPFSTAVADSALANQLVHAGHLHVFECPMAPAVGKGRWLQRNDVLRNPFFGGAMPGCGREIGAPPPGPETDRQARLGASPTDGDALLAYLRVQNRQIHEAGATDGCAGCGMSAEAMAAGEPCEHEKK